MDIWLDWPEQNIRSAQVHMFTELGELRKSETVRDTATGDKARRVRELQTHFTHTSSGFGFSLLLSSMAICSLRSSPLRSRSSCQSHTLMSATWDTQPWKAHHSYKFRISLPFHNLSLNRREWKLKTWPLLVIYSQQIINANRSIPKSHNTSAKHG